MPLVTTRLLQDDKDMQRWVTLLKARPQMHTQPLPHTSFA
jgi:hypothetical protein